MADLQQVNLTLRALVRPDEDKLPIVFRTLGTDYAQRVLPSIVNEVVKAVMVRVVLPALQLISSFQARYDAVNLLIQRDQVSREIRMGLEQRAEEFHLLIEDIAIVRRHNQLQPELHSALFHRRILPSVRSSSGPLSPSKSVNS